MRENGGTEDDSVNVFRPSIGSVVRRETGERKVGVFDTYVLRYVCC